MADGIKIEWENNSNIKLSRSLDSFDKNTQKELVKAFRETASEIRREAKRNVRRRTGALKRSIKTSVRKKKGSIIARVFADYPNNDKSSHYYAFAIEHGSKHNKAYPFLKPASNKFEGGVMERIKRVVDKEMGKI